MIVWSPVVAALDAAVAGASQVDREAIRAARGELARLGAAYDAAVAAGTIVPVSGATAAAIEAARRTAALADLERATARLEALPAVRAQIARDDGRYPLDAVNRAVRAMRLAPQSDPDAVLRFHRVMAHRQAVARFEGGTIQPSDATERDLSVAMDHAARLLAYLAA